MKKLLVLLSLAIWILLCSFSQSADRVVVIPLNSSSPVYVVGTEITSLPYVITSSGFYFITKDLIGPTGSHGISIEIDNVTLDLMGFSLIGPGGTDPYNGVSWDGKSNIEIRNGTIRNFPWTGIAGTTEQGKGNRVKNVNINNNNRNGIYLRYDIGDTVIACTAMGNGATGIEVGTSSIVTNNTSHNNDINGIFAAYGSVVTNNTSYQNGYTGITADYGSTVTNNSSWDNDKNGIFASSGSTVTGNTAYGNDEDGLVAGYGSTVTNNTAHGNTIYGIYLYDQCYVDSNTCNLNGTNMKVCATCTFGINHAP